MASTADVAVPTIRPPLEQAPIGTGNEGDFVRGNSCREMLDFLSVAGLGACVHRSSTHRPAVRLREDVVEHGREAELSAVPVALRPECEGVLEELRRVQMVVKLRVVLETIADAFVSPHALAPDRTPVGVAQLRGVPAPVGLEPLRLDADECRGRPQETVENRVPSAALGEAELGLECRGTSRPALAAAARERR